MSDPSSAGERCAQLEDPRATFEGSLGDIDRIIGSAARRLALRPDERDDFKSWVHLRLIEDDYAVIRKFGGRSSLATFLTAVVQNLARDYRIKHWGRWRPSAAAEREGTAAVLLEIHLERDGRTLDEAIESLRSNHGVRMGRVELTELAGRLSRRVRPRLEGGERVDSLAGGAPADERVVEGERAMTLSRAEEVLARSLAGLEVTDRLVLRMHYQSGLRISAIARALGLEQRQLYTRRDRSLRALRRGLDEAGLPSVDLLEALGRPASELRVDFEGDDAGEPRSDPSKEVDPGRGDDR